MDATNPYALWKALFHKINILKKNGSLHPDEASHIIGERLEPTKLGSHISFFVVEDDLAVTEHGRKFSNHTHERGQSFRFNRSALVAAVHATPQRDMLLEHTSSEHGRRIRRLDSEVVGREADRNSWEGVPKGFNPVQVDQRQAAIGAVLLKRGVHARTVQQDQVVGADHVDCVTNHLKVSHASRQNDGSTGAADVPKQRVVRQRSRGDLVAGQIELLEKVDRRLVPGGGEPQDVFLFTVLIDLLVLGVRELKSPLLIAVGCGVETARFESFPILLRQDTALERGFDHFPRHAAGLGEFIGRIRGQNVPLLKLHGVAARSDCSIDQFLGESDATIMIYADFSDNHAGVR